MSRHVTNEIPRSEAGHEPDESPTDRVMSAARRCFARFGVAKTTIEDIAGEAGMSRASVYRHVPGGRDQIVLEVLAGESEARLVELVDEVSGHKRFADQLTAALVANIGALRDDEQLAVIFSTGSLRNVTDIPGYFETAVDLVERVLGPLLSNARREGEIRSGLSDRDVAEWLMRAMAGIQFYRSETTSSQDRLDWFVRTFVVAPLLAAT